MNLKLTLLALVAAIGLGAATMTPAQAAVAYPTTPPCTSDCGGDGSEVGEIFDPFCMFSECKNNEENGGGRPGPKGDCELGGCGPTKPECELIDCDPVTEVLCTVDCAPGMGGSIPGNQAGLKLCDAQIGGLKAVTARQIKSINGRDTVQVVAVCANKNLIEQQQGVEDIRAAIASNDNMDAALGQQGLSAGDVVGVVVGRSQAVLYVHAL